jgi:hypothetical protein
MGKVASALGFSRTPLDEAPRLVSQYPMPYAANVEGPDVSLPLSLTIQPTLKFEPALSGKNEDEMALDYFLTKFGYHTNVNITTSTAAGTNILNETLGLAYRATGEENYPKPYQMVGALFRFWRGNFRIRIKFVKTKMHTARLMIAFFPGVIGSCTLDQCEYAHRDIVDIASVDELVYELPYTSRFPYLNAGASDDQGVYGSFQILVVNQLQAPSTCANNIDMIIETAMGAGAEFYQPAPAFESYPVAQAGLTSGLVKVSTLSDAKITPVQCETAQLCVGEKLMSLRQIIKYPSSLGRSEMWISTTTSSGGYLGPIYYQPHCIGCCLADGSDTALAGDYLNLLAPYFRFSRGSMRVRGGVLAPTLSPALGAVLNAEVRTAGELGLFGVTAALDTRPFGGDFNVEPNVFFKYLLPAWQSCPLVPLNYVKASDTPPYQQIHHNQSALYISGWTGLNDTAVEIPLSRQPADDYELIGFVGPPQFMTSASVMKGKSLVLKAASENSLSTKQLSAPPPLVATRV